MARRLVEVPAANNNQIPIFHRRTLPDHFSNCSLEDVKRSINRKFLKKMP